MKPNPHFPTVADIPNYKPPGPPSAEALALAVLLSGHTHCQTALRSQGADSSFRNRHVCEGCLGDAATIEKELKLKERNALEEAAKAVVVEWEGRTMQTTLRLAESVSDLREALKAL